MSRSTERRKKKKCNKGNKLSMDKVLMNEAREFFKRYKNDTTRKAYEKNYKKYIDFCRRNFNAKSKDDCGMHIQEYAYNLISQGKSASTVHTYLAPVCIYHGVSMKDIEKPIRHIAENKRSRSRENKYKRADQQYNNPQYNLAAEFQSRVGIRRAELMKLRLDDFVRDESGYWCVRVKRGKGGKFQLQRILPDDIEFVKKYFNTDSSERLFKKSDFSDKMDYHHLRALQAQRAYKYYYDYLHTGDRKQDVRNAYNLTGELMKRWNEYNKNDKGKPRPFPFKNIKGVYKLRGKNREKALKDGLAVEYDRLAVFAVSVFHLSHWRLDTLTNYLLAV